MIRGRLWSLVEAPEDCCSGYGDKSCEKLMRSCHLLRLVCLTAFFFFAQVNHEF
jgi:hypothetical protein